MKHFLTLLAVCSLSSTGFAGLTYKVQSTTDGAQKVTVVANVATDGTRGRMDLITGDGMLFKDKDIVLSSDGGKTLNVLDPQAKNYYELQLDQVIGSGAAMMKNMNVVFDNPKATVRDAGDGGTVEGLPTHKYILDGSYDMTVGVTGQKMTVAINTESWMTDRLSSDFTSFLQLRGLRVGVESVDQLIKAQAKEVKGFPLKTVCTVRVSQGGNEMVVTNTAQVTNIQEKKIDASQFVVPAGYTKVDDPITKLMKAFKQ